MTLLADAVHGLLGLLYWLAVIVATVGIVGWCCVEVRMAAERRRARRDPAGLVALGELLREREGRHG